MPDLENPSRTWRAKFRDAFRGVSVGVGSQRSFIVHVVMAVLVIVCAGILQANYIEWCLLALCIGTVMAAELFNTAFEKLVQTITDQHDERIRDTLDLASGAVLLIACAAAAVGATIFINRLLELL